MIIKEYTEKIFSQGIAIEQRGLLKSTVYGKGNIVFILNMDSTLLFRFNVTDNFIKPFGFYLNDYSGREFDIENDNTVTFLSKCGNYKKKKKVQGVKYNFSDIEKFWGQYTFEKKDSIILNSNLISLLEEGLSHVEFIIKSGIVQIKQRDIFSGTMVDIQVNTDDLFSSPIEYEGVFGLRTNDLRGLFLYSDSLTFYFNKGFVLCESDLFECLVSHCLYDDIPELKGVL